MLYGHIVGHETAGKIDEALLVYMKAPRKRALCAATFKSEQLMKIS